MSTSYSYVIHIRDEMDSPCYDEESQAFVRKPDQDQDQVKEQPRHKKRCWEPPVFFSLPAFFLQPTKKAKNS